MCAAGRPAPTGCSATAIVTRRKLTAPWICVVLAWLTAAPVLHANTASPTGIWHLNANGHRLTLEIAGSGSGLTGTIRPEGGAHDDLAHITWDASGRWLEFRRSGAGFHQWYRLSIADGVAAGRFSHGFAEEQPPLTAYTSHATGWSPTWLDTDIVPRTWRLTVNQHYEAVLRVDRDLQGRMTGRMKVFDNRALPGVQEELEYDLADVHWDGTSIAFTRQLPTGTAQHFAGTASGRFIAGTFHSSAGDAPMAWSGTRSQVLGFGLGSRLSTRASWRTDRQAWQERTRSRLMNLTQGMRQATAPPVAVTVTELPCTECPFTATSYPPERDDDPDQWPPDYTLRHLLFTVQAPHRFAPAQAAPARELHGYLAIPNGDPPPGGFPAAVVLNGHGSSARHLLQQDDGDPAGGSWYGESAARRRMVVLAVDVGHRTEWQADGPVHPAIVGGGFSSSDWEEDGERSFSVTAAIDYLLSLPYVNADGLSMAGLSMGGEVALITAAMDPRIAVVTVAGYTPDMHVMDVQGNHPCYLWQHADIHEYVDISDYASLVAPRGLIVQTGRQDHVFSSLPTPWASAKQVVRRALAAYDADDDRLVHYLHYDAHRFHVGDYNPTHPSRPRGVTETLVNVPTSPLDLSWQTDDETVVRAGRDTLYALIGILLSSAGDTPCTVALGEPERVVSSEATSGTVSVLAPSSCAWTVSPLVPAWMQASGTGSGDGIVQYTVDANPSAQDRTGTVTIGGAVFTLVQRGRPQPPVGPPAVPCAEDSADFATWRPADGMWHIRSSCDGDATPLAFQWGLGALHDRPVPGDYDGDGLTDLAVWRATDGMWHVHTSSSGYQESFAIQWGAGALGDVPVPADFDGDGRTDIAVWRPGNGVWYVRTSMSGYQASFTVQWGAGVLGDVPVPADYDGDGRADIAVWRPGNGVWYVRTSTSGYQASFTVQWGTGVHRDIPLPADYDGDGRADLAVWRPDTGDWHVRRSSSGYAASYSVRWGVGEVPIVGRFGR
jgi:dienelactone hydrolase